MIETSAHAYPIKQGRVASVLEDRIDRDSDCHLVLIHGMGDSCDVWRAVCQRLHAGFRSYQEMSIPWTTAVGLPISYEPSAAEMMRSAWAQLPAGPKIVLAHSFGANALLAMAQHDSLDDVKALVLLSVYFKPRFEDFTWPLFVRYVNEFDRFITMSIESRSQGKPVSEQTKNVIRDKTKELYSPPNWVQFYMVFSTTPGLTLSHLTMPALVMGGKEDFSIEDRDLEEFAKKLPDADYYCFDQCGHFAMIEQPDLAAGLIQDFLIKRKLICQRSILSSQQPA